MGLSAKHEKQLIRHLVLTTYDVHVTQAVLAWSLPPCPMFFCVCINFQEPEMGIQHLTDQSYDFTYQFIVLRTIMYPKKVFANCVNI